LENLTFSYNLTGVRRLENIRLYVTGNNLFVITKYKGIDPEIAPVNGAGGGSNSAYLDVSYTSNGFYPKSRSVTFGVSCSLK
jgi:iron complex outermembrane receptor protein